MVTNDRTKIRTKAFGIPASVILTLPLKEKKVKNKKRLFHMKRAKQNGFMAVGKRTGEIKSEYVTDAMIKKY